MTDGMKKQSSRNKGGHPPGKKGRKHRKDSYWVYILAVLAGLLLVLYLRGLVYYSSHFHRNTYINGVPMGGKTVKEAERYFNEDFDSHDIELIEKERTEFIAARSVVEKISVDDQIKDIRIKMHSWIWFTDLFGKKNYTITLQADYDEEKLISIMDSLECFKDANVTESKDACIRPGKKDYRIEPEVVGNQVDRDALLKRLETAICQNITSIDLEKEKLYIVPKVYADDEDLLKALDTANSYAKSVIVYDFNRLTERVDYNVFKDWLTFSDSFEVDVDEDMALDYILELARKYNTMGRPHHFRTSAGKNILITDGDYGWKIDTAKEKKQLAEDIKSGKKVNRKPFFSYEARGYYSKVDDIGDSYVEVSIKEQKLWLYIDGRCKMRAFVVTGDPVRHYDTEKGVYSLTYKESPSTLTGVNSNGSAYSSDVSYWMPFNRNQGLHDAPWRNSFGGSEYRGNGSHGCVNCPVNVAKVLYENIEAGFPVIIY